MSAPARRTVAPRRRSSGSGPRLGAVKLQSPLLSGATDAGSPMSTCSEPTSAHASPQSQSPLAGRPAVPPAPPAAADGLAEFSRLLTSNRSADRWLEEQERSSPGTQGAAHGRHQSTSRSPLGQQPVESATTQIVHKALRFITDQAPSPSSAREAAEHEVDGKPGFDSQTFLDKGMDAISGVGKLMEGFAITLDTVIGQAFEDWGSTVQPGRAGKPLRRLAPQTSSASIGTADVQRSAAEPRPSIPATARCKHAGWQDFDDEGVENSSAASQRSAAPLARAASKQQATVGGQGVAAAGRQPRITSFMSKLDAASEHEVAEWRRRAQQLAGELQRMRKQQEEYQCLKLQYDKLQTDLQQASTAASRLAEENCELKSREDAADPALGAGVADPLAVQQVARQMEALLVEKSKLVQENDRLLRENTGLQELLEFTLQHTQLAGDGELFGYDEAVLPSPADQSPPASEAGERAGGDIVAAPGDAALAAVPASA